MAHPLLEQVARLRRRRQGRRWATAIGWLVAVTVGAALAAMLADYAVRSQDRGLRWLAAGCVLAAAVVVTRRRVAPVVERPETDGGVARAIESRFPQLGSRVASAVEFLRQPSDNLVDGSPALRRAVVIEATSEVEQIEVDEVIDPLPARRASLAAVAAVAAVVVFGFADGAGLSVAATRLAAPWRTIDWPRQNQLTVNDAPPRIARGQTFEAIVVDEAGTLPTDLRVQYRTSERGRVDEQALSPDGEQATLRRPNVQKAFEFRVVGGDDDTMAWTGVDVLEPPAPEDLVVTAEPPAYSGLPAGTTELDIQVLAGTKLALRGQSDKRLSAAAVEVAGQEGSRLIAGGVDGADGVAFATSPTVWLDPNGDDPQPTRAAYRVRLETPDGLVGETDSRVLMVLPDTPPAVSWGKPASDQFVTARAQIAVEAAAADNLAVRWVELVATQPAADPEGAGGETESDVTRVRLHTGPAEPPPRPQGLAGDGETIEAAGAVELASFELEVGDQLLLSIEASDYRPGVGRTAFSRRVTIISDAEAENRIAEAATGLTRDIERALALQREARAGAEQLAIEQKNGVLKPGQAVDRAASLGYQQGEVASAVADPARGAAEQARQLLEAIKQNRLNQPELAEQLASAASELERVASGAIAEAGRSLAEARRAAARQDGELDGEQAKQAAGDMAGALAAAEEAQEQAVEKLEAIADGLSRFAELERLAREASQLERQQRELAEESRRQAVEPNGPGGDAARQAEREKLAATQREIGRRFDRLMQSMRDEVQSSQDGDNPTAKPVEDALAEATERATGGKLRDASRRLAQGQLGRAAGQQQAAADDLRELLDTLRNRPPRDAKQLADQLNDTQERLAELQRQTEQQASQPSGDAEREAAEREQLAEQAERLARRMERLTADDAAESTEQSGQQLSQSASQSGSNQSGAKQSLSRAQQKLDEAQQKLAERRQQLQDEITQTALQKLANEIDLYVDRQRQVLEETVTAADQRPGPPRRERTERLANEQSDLRGAIAEAAKDLADRDVFDLALRRAAGDMAAAADGLAGDNPGAETQRREHAALTRLRHVSQVLRPDPNLPDPEQDEQKPQQPGGGGGKQPEPPPIAVAELKMLRLMQLDVTARTRDLEADTAAGDAEPAELETRSARLVEEQSQLTELVRDLASRDNGGR